jgi:hypothetical protein
MNDDVSRHPLEGARIAISYARFSSAGQAVGDSLRRQSEAAEAYAAQNGLVLDKQLSFSDLGVSAYDQSNVRKGALGLFLKAIEAGRIPVGSTLIVESFDRLSRATPIDALGVFTDIINAGLTIVTLTQPPKSFSRESIQGNVFQLFEVLVDMHRANAESARKAGLVSSAWKNKKVRAQTGAIMTRRAPHWIDVEVKEELSKDAHAKRVATINAARAAVVMRLVESAERGVGNHTLIRQLHEEKIPAWSSSGRWQPSYIQKIMRNPALFGAINLDGELCENYYPALIDKNRYLRLQVLRSARATTKATNRGGEVVTNLFSGRLKCGYCGSAMNVAGYKSRKTGYDRKYVACHGARIGSPEARAVGCRMHMWFLDQLEPKLLLWLTGLDYQSLMTTDRSQAEKARALLAGIERDMADLARRVGNITRLIEDGDGTKALIHRQRELEAEAERLQQQANAQRDKVLLIESTEQSGKSRMDALIALFREMQKLRAEDSKIKLRILREQLSAAIAQTVERVRLFPTGPTLQADKSQRYMVVELKSGKQYEIDASDGSDGIDQEEAEADSR